MQAPSLADCSSVCVQRGPRTSLAHHPRAHGTHHSEAGLLPTPLRTCVNLVIGIERFVRVIISMMVLCDGSATV